MGLPVGTVVITDISDAKKDIAKAARVKEDKVIERFFPLMTIDLLRAREKYSDSGADYFEITNVISDFLTMVEH